ncbi:MAG: divalent metal cation transporter [Chloroflexi bacterium]|nr:divalent metal cation transporter [Chloroflexota bacterium]
MARYLSRRKTLLALAAATVGPGLMVMLADTDAGSIVTAAQSGARWGYLMVLPQILLIPILYFVQEVTIRLGIVTQKGHGELIRQRFGWGWAMLSVSTLFLASLGALVTEFAGIAGAGELFGVPSWLTVSLATLLLIALGLSGSYRRVERVGIAIGLFELAFFPAAIMARPDVGAMVRDLPSLPLANQDYLFFLAANVGAVIMPWMVFYQQGAVINKGLTLKNLRAARLDTFLGSVLTQLVMLAVVIAAAATIGRTNPTQALDSIQQIAAALEPFLGWGGARVAFGLGMVGAGFIAALVVSLAGSWGITEALGLPHSLNDGPRKARWFYLIYTLAHIGGAIVVLSGISLITLTIDIEVMNAALLPIVLGFLLALEARVLPKEVRMKGLHRYTVWSLSGVVMAFGLFIALRTVLLGT